MPAIIAICPYCRAGGVRASETAIGASATCPKCKSSFTVLPEENLPDWAAKAQPGAMSFSAPGTAIPRSSPLEETCETSAMPDVTEPSPVLPAEPKKPEPKPAPVLSSLPPGEQDSTSEGPPPGVKAAAQPPQESEESGLALSDYGMVFALGSLCLVGPAMVATLFPFGRFIGLALAAVGLVVGLLALGAEGRARLAGGLGALLHFIALVLLLFLPSWLGLDSWSTPAAPEGPKGPFAVENGSSELKPVSPDDWLDAEKYSWQNGDMRVSVRSGVGPVELLGPKESKRTTKESYLHLTVRTRNIGFERELPLSGWAAGQGAEGVRVTDASGKVLLPAVFDAGWTVVDRGRPGRAMPGHGSEVVLVFTAPPARTDFVHVQLSGAAVGVEDEIKFRAGTAPVLPRMGTGPGAPPMPGP